MQTNFEISSYERKLPLLQQHSTQELVASLRKHGQSALARVGMHCPTEPPACPAAAAAPAPKQLQQELQQAAVGRTESAGLGPLSMQMSLGLEHEPAAAEGADDGSWADFLA